MRTNGESIYATTASPFPALAWGRCTRRGKAGADGKGCTLYLHVFTWPPDGALDVPMRVEGVRAALLAAPGQALEVTADGAHTKIRLPAAAPDPIASVVKVELSGEPAVAPDAAGEKH